MNEDLLMILTVTLRNRKVQVHFLAKGLRGKWPAGVLRAPEGSLSCLYSLGTSRNASSVILPLKR